MYKYFQIDDDNLKFLDDLKKKSGFKTDKAALNYIIRSFQEQYEKKEEEQEPDFIADKIAQKFSDQFGAYFTKTAAALSSVDHNSKIVLDILNTYLSKDQIEQCILTDIVPSPVIRKSEEYHKYQVRKAKQKKDNR